MTMTATNLNKKLLKATLKISDLRDHIAELESTLREGLEVANDLINKTDIYLGINDAYDRHDKWEKQALKALKEGE